MNTPQFRSFVVRLSAFALLAMGFVQSSHAALIGTQDLIASKQQEARITRIDALLARQDVANQLISLGVDPQDVRSRVANMTPDELRALEGKIDQHVAGGDAIGVIGVVFLVLLILELVGVTDIFKKL